MLACDTIKFIHFQFHYFTVITSVRSKEPESLAHRHPRSLHAPSSHASYRRHDEALAGSGALALYRRHNTLAA